MRMNYLYTVSAFSIVILLQHCGGPLPQRESLIIRLTDTSAEVVNVDSLSIVPPADSLNLEQEAKPLLTVTPEYPVKKKAFRSESEIWVRAWITSDGNVKRVYIKSSTDPEFNQAVLHAVAQWQFRPAVKEGKSIDCWVEIPFRFRIAK